MRQRPAPTKAAIDAWQSLPSHCVVRVQACGQPLMSSPDLLSEACIEEEWSSRRPSRQGWGPSQGQPSNHTPRPSLVALRMLKPPCEELHVEGSWGPNQLAVWVSELPGKGILRLQSSLPMIAVLTTSDYNLTGKPEPAPHSQAAPGFMTCGNHER